PPGTRSAQGAPARSPRYCSDAWARHPILRRRSGSSAETGAPPAASSCTGLALDPADAFRETELHLRVDTLAPSTEPLVLVPENPVRQQDPRNGTPSGSTQGEWLQLPARHGTRRGHIESWPDSFDRSHPPRTDNERVDAWLQHAHVERVGGLAVAARDALHDGRVRWAIEPPRIGPTHTPPPHPPSPPPPLPVR